MRRKLKITKTQTAETMYVYFFLSTYCFFVGGGVFSVKTEQHGKTTTKTLVSPNITYLSSPLLHSKSTALL